MPRARFTAVLVAFVALLIIPGCSRNGAEPSEAAATAQSPQPPATRTPVRVLVPCGMASAFRDLVPLVHEDLPDIRLLTRTVPVVEMTDKVLSGEIEGDIFTSLGYKEIERLQEAGRLAGGSVRNIARFRLALITIKDNPLGVHELKDLLKPEVEHVTMPPPHENSVGYYTQDVLRSAGLWDQLQSKLVYPEHSAEVIKYMRKGWADAAVVYDTCLIETYTPTGESKKSSSTVEKVAMIDPDLYPTLYAPAGILVDTEHADAASRVVDYLLTDNARPCFRKYGYLSPDEPDDGE